MIKDDYFIKISPEFLFDVFNVYDSVYTPWVYIQLKLKYNYYLEKIPHKMYSIDVKGISSCLNTTPQTVYDSLKDLEATGLLEKKKRKYRILNESGYVNKYRKVDDNEKRKLPKFIRIYHNYFHELLSGIKKLILPMENYHRCIIKCLRIYYYLQACNKHCLTENPIMESELTQTSLEKELKHDHRIIKPLMSFLEDAGYIKIEEGRIFTINKDLYEPEKHKLIKHDNSEPAHEEKKIITVTDKKADIKKVPEKFIGFCKSEDGTRISVIYYYSKNERAIVGWCKGDGVPATEEEITISNDLLTYGKKSNYYNPETYWLYKSESEQNKDAA